MSPSRLRIYHQLQLAAHRLRRAADRALVAASGVTTAQAAILTIVASKGGASQRFAARQLGLNESAVTAMVARLGSMDLIERTRDETDARAWRLLLTPKGQMALNKVEPAFREINERIGSALDQRELTALVDSLSRISAAFEDK